MKITHCSRDTLLAKLLLKIKKIDSLAILDLAFRPFFLLAVLASVVALTQWILLLSGNLVSVSYSLTPLAFHMHEMIFGFGATVAVGFLLTAVQTWTGGQSVKGLNLLYLVVLWLAVRTSLYLGGDNSLLFALVFQLLWWLMVIYYFSRLVVSTANKQNYLFIPLLSALMCLNMAFIIADMINLTEVSRHLARTSILLFCLLMGVLGSRVIPFFTVRVTEVVSIHVPALLSKIIWIVSLAGIFVFFFGYFFTLPFTPSALMILAGVLHLIRLSYWRSLSTYTIPLLWSLHLSYCSIGVGLIILGLSYQLSAITFGDALHLITIAAMGLMIFSMMSRVSLGHTGRALVVHTLVPWLFVAVFVAAIARFFLSVLVSSYTAWLVSTLLWFIASLIFLYVYTPILFSQKDNKLVKK